MSGDVVIRAEGLGKKYIIGHEAERERYTALRDVIGRRAKAILRTTSDMLRGRAIVGGDTVEEFWALKNVNFEVKRGEVVGIIGRNGAGKSTLLKILSRITEPTTGRVEIRGRVASLLEVGTGFHPELTGRENIFLNGAILGMSRAEIRRKFDEIVAFADIERFLDTPVKRYSSGMYVRLAFAVAAHLEPEILIVDEVLAVGDAEFQKKCLGKMQDVAGDGRTVLFVSHSLVTIQTLCERGMLLRNGSLLEDSGIEQTVTRYTELHTNRPSALSLQSLRRSGERNVVFEAVTFVDGQGHSVLGPTTGKSAIIRIAFGGTLAEKRSSRVGLTFRTLSGTDLFLCANEVSRNEPLEIGAGTVVYCKIPRFPLPGGSYGLSLFLERNGRIEDWVQEDLIVDVKDDSFFGTTRNLPNRSEIKFVLVPNEWGYGTALSDPEK